MAQDNQTVIGIYLSPIDDHVGAPVFASELYEKAYPQLFSLLIKQGARVCLVYDRARTYQRKGIFSEYYQAQLDQSSGDISYHKHSDQIHLPFLYDKSRFGDDPGLYVLNPEEIVDICSDKMKSYELIPDLHPKTQLAPNNATLQNYLDSWQGKYVVVKSLDSNGGKEVYIGSPDGYDMALPFPVIVQEYVETSVGIPGLVDGRHDVRVGLYNGQIIQGRLRTPPPDGLLSNIAFGGSNRVLATSEIPKETQSIARDVDSRFAQYPERFISVDCAFSDQGWKVFEINCWPGLVDCEAGQLEAEFMQTLAQNLVASAQKYH